MKPNLSLWSWFLVAAVLAIVSGAALALLASAEIIPSVIRNPISDFAQPGVTVWWFILGGPFRSVPSSPTGIAFAAVANAALWLLVLLLGIAVVHTVRRMLAGTTYMSAMLQVVPPTSATDRVWLSLRSRLWPDGAESEHLRYIGDALARGHFVRLASAPDGSAVGFVEASQRVDYVNGTSTSPVAFLEGLYVEPSARRQGVARALVAEVERWAAAQGA